MAGNDDSRKRGGKPGTDEVAKVLLNASKACDRGEMAEAAGWYRRAAKLLLEDDQEDRALQFAKLAAELDSDVETGRTPASPESSVEVKPSGAARTGSSKADGTGKHKSLRGAPEAPAPSKAEMTGKNKALRGDTASGKAGRRATGEFESGKTQLAVPKPSAAVALPPRTTATSPSVPPRPMTSPAKIAEEMKVAVVAEVTPAVPPVQSAPAVQPTTSPKSVLPPRPSIPAPRPSSSTPSIPAPRPNSAPLPRASIPPPSASRFPSAGVPVRSETPPKLPTSSPQAMPSPLRGGTVKSTPPPPAIAPAPDAQNHRTSEMEGAHPAIAAAEVGVPAAPINAPTRSRASELEYVRARLALLPFLDELLSDRVREVARQVRLITCEDGGSLFDAGDVSGPLFAITSGTAVVELSGEPTSLVTVHEGEVAGAVSALFGDRRRGNARARGKLEAFAFAPSLVRALAVEYGTFRAYLDNIARARVAESLPRAAVGVRGIDQATRRQLFESCDWVTMPEGALLQLEGVAAGAIYFIGAGEAEVFGPSVDSRHVQRIGVGALIGAGSLRDDSFAVVNVRASTRLLVARLAGAKYRRFAAAHSDAARALGAASAG